MYKLRCKETKMERGLRGCFATRIHADFYFL